MGIPLGTAQSHELAPVLELKLGGHSSHTVEPVLGVYVPERHGEQPPFPAALIKPALQGEVPVAPYSIRLVLGVVPPREKVVEPFTL